MSEPTMDEWNAMTDLERVLHQDAHPITVAMMTAARNAEQWTSGMEGAYHLGIQQTKVEVRVVLGMEYDELDGLLDPTPWGGLS